MEKIPRQDFWLGINLRWIRSALAGGAVLLSPLHAQTPNPLPGAVGQQAVTDAAAQQERERQRQMNVQPRPEDKEAVDCLLC